MESVVLLKKGRLKRKIANCAMGIFLSAAMTSSMFQAVRLAAYASDRKVDLCEYNQEQTADCGYAEDGNSVSDGSTVYADAQNAEQEDGICVYGAQSGEIKVDTQATNVFAQGIPIVIKQNGSITSIYDNNGMLLTGETDVSTYQIYGGWFNEAGQGSPSIVMESGKVNKIYGGSYIETLTGSPAITVKGGTVDTIYGGSFMGQLTGSPAITVKGGKVNELYGGGSLGAATQGSTDITIEDGTITWLYGGGYSNAQTEGASITVKGGTILGQIYGGGKNSTVGNACFEVLLANLSQTVKLDGSQVTGSTAARFSGRKASGQYGAAMLKDIDVVTAEDCKLILLGAENRLDMEKLDIPATGEVVFPVENQSVIIGYKVIINNVQKI